MVTLDKYSTTQHCRLQPPTYFGVHWVTLFQPYSWKMFWTKNVSSSSLLITSLCIALIIDDAASRCLDWDWDHCCQYGMRCAVTALRHPHVPPRPLPRPPGIDHPVTGTRHGSWETWNQIVSSHHLHLSPIISVTKSHDNYVTKLPNVQCGNYFLIISIIV